MKETYGAQPPIEILRQLLDHELWYDRKENVPMKIIDLLVHMTLKKRNKNCMLILFFVYYYSRESLFTFVFRRCCVQWALHVLEIQLHQDFLGTLISSVSMNSMMKL